jgi:hypothetical protein
VAALTQLPDRRFSAKFLLTGLAAWAITRAGLAFGGAATEDIFGPPPLALEIPTSLLLAAVCGAVVALDVLRRHERILLANLGVPLPVVVAIGAIPAIATESLISLAAAVIG